MTVFIRSFLQITEYKGVGTGLQFTEEELVSKVGSIKVQSIKNGIDDKGAYMVDGLSNTVLKELIDSFDMTIIRLSLESNLSIDTLNNMYNLRGNIRYLDVMELLKLKNIDPITYLLQY